MRPKRFYGLTFTRNAQGQIFGIEGCIRSETVNEPYDHKGPNKKSGLSSLTFLDGAKTLLISRCITKQFYKGCNKLYQYRANDF